MRASKLSSAFLLGIGIGVGIVQNFGIVPSPMLTIISAQKSSLCPNKDIHECRQLPSKDETRFQTRTNQKQLISEEGQSQTRTNQSVDNLHVKKKSPEIRKVLVVV